MLRKYGYKKDKIDPRDILLKDKVDRRVTLPSSKDLRTTGYLSPVYDQGQLGSCTANAIASAIDFERKSQGKSWLYPSRLFIYYGERKIEGTLTEDAGAEIRDGIKVVASLGVCPESEWSYDDGPTKFAKAPPAKDFKDALQYQTLKYSRVTQIDYYIKHCLAILNKPVIFGFSVYDAFESAEVERTGIVPMPSGPSIGGHAVLAVGYNDATKRYIVKNSWGTSWGQQGYFEIPYAYVEDSSQANDFWTILLEE